MLLRRWFGIASLCAMAGRNDVFHLDGKSLAALSVGSVKHWRLAGEISVRFSVLWIIKEQGGREATYTFQASEWDGRVFAADSK